jgi:mannan endo-1,4-beta-mannosidase
MGSSRLVARALGGVALLILALSTSTVVEAANVGIVRAQGDRFVLNGRTFYFVGTNAYWMIPLTALGAPAYADDQLALAQALGFNVMRVMGFADGPGTGMGGAALQPAPGVFNEASFRAFDYVLHKADLAGVRLLIALTNGNPAYGGAGQYLQWCGGGSERAFYESPACRALYKNYLTYVLNRVNTYNGRRYKDDPTVFGWELANEPRIEHYADPSGQVIRSWVAEIAAHIKAHDPNHMVATGEEGYDVTSAGYAPVSAYNNQGWLFDGNKGLAWTQNTADRNIDFGSIHLYPELWNLAAPHGNAWIADHVRIARALGKPLVLGEFGMSQNAAATFDSWLQTLHGNNGAGALVWQVMCGICYAMRDQFGILFPPGSSVINVLAGSAAFATSKSGGAAGGPPPGPASATANTMVRGLVGGAGSALNLVVRGTDNGIYHARFDGSQWSKWSSPGGATLDAPALVSRGGGTLDVVVRGTDSMPYHGFFDGSQWRGWTALGGKLLDSPALVARAGGLDLVVRGVDNGIYYNRFNGSAWSGWSVVGGFTLDSPALVANSSGGLDLVVRGRDSGIYHNRFDGSTWSGWSFVGGYTLDGPALVANSVGGLDLVVRGVDSGVYHNRFNGGWSGWRLVGGATLDTPALVAAGGGGLELMIRGTDSGIYHNRFDGGKWLGWSAVGGKTAETPALVLHSAGLELLVRGIDNGVYHNRSNWVQWSGWFMGGAH